MKIILMLLTFVDSQHVLTKIESIFEDIADALLKKKQRLAIILKSRSNVARPRSENNTSPNPQSREVCFPGSNQREAWRFGDYCLATS